MKFITLLAFGLLTKGLLGQQLDSLGVDNQVTPNRQETAFFNLALKELRDTFDFNNKKIAFVTGSSSSKLLSKNDYLKNCVKPWAEKDSTPQIFMVRLTNEESKKSGGYNVLVFSRVKVLTNKKRK